jgi:hypothetical protein
VNADRRTRDSLSFFVRRNAIISIDYVHKDLNKYQEMIVHVCFRIE